MLRRLFRLLLSLIVLITMLLAGIWAYRHFILPPPQPPTTPSIPSTPTTPNTPTTPSTVTPQTTPSLPPLLRPATPEHVSKLINSVLKQVETTRSYDPAYVVLKYPGGDVKANTGVCADVVIRAFRAQGIDLQKAVHEDMLSAFSDYPKKWGLKSPDSNIDHRRVYNLMKFFERKGKALPITHNPADYLPGDVVAWDLGGGQGHIGIVMTEKTPEGVPAMGHNVGYGTNIEDALFFWPIIGHYRYFTTNPNRQTH